MRQGGAKCTTPTILSPKKKYLIVGDGLKKNNMWNRGQKASCSVYPLRMAVKGTFE